MSPQKSKETVFIIDDDAQALNSVCALVHSMGFTAVAFRSAEEFLEAGIETCFGCVVTDVRMMGMNGLDLQMKLRDLGSDLPVIVITAYARTQFTVRAMKQGAVTLLEKPYDENELWDAIHEALQISRDRLEQTLRRRELQRRFGTLSMKELITMRHIVTGQTNKAVAHLQNVSVRTVETRRQKIFKKLGIATVAELVPLFIEYENFMATGFSTPSSFAMQHEHQGPHPQARSRSTASQSLTLGSSPRQE